MTLKEARKIVAKPSGKVVTEAGPLTDVIVSYVRPEQVEQLAESLRGSDNFETFHNIFDFLKTFKYKQDPAGVQYIKTPEQVVHSGVTDCKGYSILTSSLLSALGINHVFRFVSYGSSAVPTHVYIVAEGVALDACTNELGTELDYNYKKDYNMKVYGISGLPGFNDNDFENISGYPGLMDMTPEAAALYLRRESAEIERNYIKDMMPFGPDKMRILAAYDTYTARNISGRDTTPQPFERRNIFQNAAGLIADLFKDIKSELAEKTLPKIAMFFLPLFIPAALIQKGNAKLKRHFNIVSTLAKIVSKITGMSEDATMRLIANSISKITGKPVQAYALEYAKSITKPAARGGLQSQNYGGSLTLKDSGKKGPLPVNTGSGKKGGAISGRGLFVELEDGVDGIGNPALVMLILPLIPSILGVIAAIISKKKDAETAGLEGVQASDLNFEGLEIDAAASSVDEAFRDAGGSISVVDPGTDGGGGTGGMGMGTWLLIAAAGLLAFSGGGKGKNNLF